MNIFSGGYTLPAPPCETLIIIIINIFLYFIQLRKCDDHHFFEQCLIQTLEMPTMMRFRPACRTPFESETDCGSQPLIQKQH
jgi:hypothetical protein